MINAWNTTSDNPATAQEQDAIANLCAMIGELNPDVVLQVLRKHSGNVERAADALLNEQYDANAGSAIPPLATVVNNPSAVIDLTGDDQDDEMKRALQMSMETENRATTFAPSNRAPDPNWAMVPSNAQVQPPNDDEGLKQAIEASLALAEEDEELPMEGMLREGGRPIAVRPDSAPHAYAALLLHALFHVPQVRQRLSRLPLSTDPADELLHRTVEMFTNMDLAVISRLAPTDLFNAMEVKPAAISDSPGELTKDLYEKFAGLFLDHAVSEEPGSLERDRLFSFTSAIVEMREGVLPTSTAHRNSFVLVDIGGSDTNGPNELVARLSTELTKYTSTGSTHSVICQPSNVVTFYLRNADRPPSSLSSPDAFVYPKSIYMDQFLEGNLLAANEKRAQQKNVQAQIAEHEKTKAVLTHSDGMDVLSNLRAVIHYYEHVAKADTPEREATVQEAAKKFQATYAGVEAKVKELEAKVAELQRELKTIFDCPEFQKFRYDVRAVLMHDGVPGRKHIYSYVQDVRGTWWKTVDASVTEVPEDVVFTDSTGLHLNAGPYMLIYSRSLTQEQLDEPLSWPQPFVDSVKQNNEAFLASLRSEGVGSSLSHSEANVTLQEKANDSMDVSMVDLTASP